MATPLRIQIDLAGVVPAARQIADQLRARLVDGELAPGDRLPSVRRLAVDLGVHFNTVAGAYRALADEGWLDVSQGRHVRVIERATPSPTADTRARFRQGLRQVVADARAGGLSESFVARELAELAERFQS